MTTALERMGRAELLSTINRLDGEVQMAVKGVQEFAAIAQQQQVRITELETDNARLEKNHAIMLENLTAVQARCTNLIDQLRGWRYLGKLDKSFQVISDILAEVWRANAKFGTPEQLAFTRPDGIGSADQVAYVVLAKDRCDRAMANGGAPWSVVLDEENAECGAAKSEEELKPELRQVAATAIRWHLAIDARGAR